MYNSLVTLSNKKIYVDKRSAKNNPEGIPRKRVNSTDKRNAIHNLEGTPRIYKTNAKNNFEGTPHKGVNITSTINSGTVKFFFKLI